MEIVQRLTPAVKNNTASLTAGILLNNWVAVSGITGDTTVPDGIISRILEHLKKVDEQGVIYEHD